ncbi:unnamed protein product [Hapterophycus canaliculatus]
MQTASRVARSGMAKLASSKQAWAAPVARSLHGSASALNPSEVVTDGKGIWQTKDAMLDRLTNRTYSSSPMAMGVEVRADVQDEELAGEEAPKRHTCTDPNCCHVDHDHDRDADVDNAVEEFGSTFGAGRREMSTSAGPPADHPVWNRPSLDHLLENNKKWVSSVKAEDPDYFKRLASIHTPEHLFIGCSDARLSVQSMLGLSPGEIFIHRNVANMVMHNDLSMLTVLTYAVDYLKVKNVIVCGHYECGGVRASMANNDHGLIENWIMGVKDVARIHSEELMALGDDELIHRRLVELNVQEQCIKLYNTPVLQKAHAEKGGPHVHGIVFDVGEGLVKELDVDFKSLIQKNANIFSMYDFNKPVA